ncbi:hypothetical protein L293_2911 [Acinetobacter gyllenbergii CIP 110306 = MTCC 11365]|nr:hypothetical protein L293_2911 [Acinetobacter gyllenbergii CIP 110306 = MTCC 11365]
MLIVVASHPKSKDWWSILKYALPMNQCLNTVMFNHPD